MKGNQNKRVKSTAILAAVVLGIIALAFGVAKFVLQKNDEDNTLNFYEYRIQTQEISFSPNDEYTNGEVTVTINPNILGIANVGKTGSKLMTIEYKLTELDDNTPLGETGWTTYTGPFNVDHNMKVNARLVSVSDYNFKGPVTDKDITKIAVAKIGDKTYKTLAEAITAWGNLSNAEKENAKIEMVANTNESVTIPSGENVVIDLKGYTITGETKVTDPNTQATESQSATAITLNGTLNLIDSGKQTTQGGNTTTTYGSVTSTANTAVQVSATGTLTLGTNESATSGNDEVVNTNGPVINGGTGSNGVTVADGGNLNFYDGKITAPAPVTDGDHTAIVVGETQVGESDIDKINTPSGYRLDVSVDSQSGREVATLIKTMTVSFDTNGGTPSTIDSIEAAEGKAYGTYATWPSDPTRDGYTFGGWEISNNNVTSSTIVTQTTNHTLTAIWNPITYTINYNNNTGAGTIENTTATYDDTFTLPTSTSGITKTGYTLKGWSTNQNANPDTDTIYTPGQTVSNLTTTNNDTVTLYAIWKDETAPTNTAPTGTSTTSTITVTCNQTDEGSGIDTNTIQYSIFKDGAWTEWQDDATFDNLTANTTYRIKTRAKDTDGNGYTESTEGTVKTQQIQNATTTIHKDTANGDEITSTTGPIKNTTIVVKVEESTTGGTTTVKITDPDGNESIYNLNNLTKDEDGTYHIEIPNTKTGEYTVTTETTDGTNTATNTVTFEVDRTSPTISETIIPTTNTITVTAGANDVGSGIDTVTYTLLESDGTPAKDANDQDVVANSTGVFNNLKENHDYKVQITVTDKAGNTTTKTADAKTTELVAGTLTFKEASESTNFTPNTTEPQTAGDKVWKNDDIDVTIATQGNGTSTTYTYQKVGGEASAPISSTTSTIPTENGDYVVTVTTTDGVNTKTRTYYFSIDKTLPTVAISPNSADIDIPQASSSGNITSTLTITEAESGIASVRYAITNDNLNAPANNQWTNASASDLVSISSTQNAGTYYIWTEVTDNAGNVSTSVKTSGAFNVKYVIEYDMNIDKTAVEIISEKTLKTTGNSATIASAPTREGYIFKGWALDENATTATHSAGADYTITGSVRFYAVWSEVVATLKIGNGEVVEYDSVQGAITAAGSSEDAVVTLVKSEISEEVTVAAGQEITLNTGTSTLTSTGTTVTNAGTLTITGNGEIVTTSSNNSTVSNTGILNVTDGTIKNTGTGSGDANPIKNNSSGAVVISGGTIDSKSAYAIVNVSSGNITVNAGTIKGSAGIINAKNSTGTIIINGGTVNSSGHGIRTYNGNVEINGGEIKTPASDADGIWSSGTGNVLVTGGTITAGTNGIVTTGTGSITITGGTIEAKYTQKAGYAVNAKGILTLGNKDDENIASSESPVLIGSNKGVVFNGSEFNFYDGIIKAPTGQTISGTVTNTQEGYSVINGTEGTLETAYLDNHYTVTYNYDNATSGNTETGKTVTYGEAYGTLPSPEKTGYTFGGWKLNTTIITASSTVNTANDHTLTAQWTANTYTVTANANNGTIPATTGWTVASGSATATKTVTYDSTYGTLPTPTRTGYTFNGWKDANENTYTSTDTVNITANTEIIAQWTANDYTITFNYDGATSGNTLTQKTVTYDNTYGELPTPEKTGYTFDGWYIGTTKIEPTSTVAITSNQTLTAHWTANEYTITYNLNDGAVLISNPTTYTAESNDITLTNPAKTGYTFAGWTGTGLSEATLNVTIPKGSVGNREYTANWTANVYKVTLDNQGADTAGTEEYYYQFNTTDNRNGHDCYYYTTRELTTPINDGVYSGTGLNGVFITKPTKEGYTFNGYFTNTDGQGTLFVDSTGLAQNNMYATKAEDTTLYAYWTPTQYTITYDYNGGTPATGSASETATYTIEDTVTLPTAEKTGYNFVGWKEQGAEDSTAVTQLSATTGNKNLVAVYTSAAVSYKIHHLVENANNDNYTEEPVEVVTTLKGVTPETLVTTGTVITLDNTQAKSIANTTVYKVTATPDGTNGGSVTVAADSSTEIYVYYKRVKFDLTVTAGNYTKNATGTGSYKWGQTVNISAENEGATGYDYSDFAWTTTDTSILASASAQTTTLTMPAGNTTVTATSTKTAKTYTITYNLANGTVGTANPETYTIESNSFTLNNPTKAGYTFAGWTGTGLSGATTSVTIAKGSTGNRTYTATWTPINYTIGYDLAGGSVSGTNPTSYTIESNNITLINPTKVGYTFAGWTGTDLNEATSAVTIAKGSMGNRAYVATWTPNTDTEYTVNYYVHDLGAATYTLNSTETLTGTTDSSVTVASLAKSITGHTFEAGYVTGNTTKPTSGAVTSATISADGSMVINMYYRPNRLYVRYDMNSGNMSATHGEGYGTLNSLVTYTGNETSTDFLRGVYGSKVGGVTESTYSIASNGLHDLNYSSAINLEKTGYSAKSGAEWNTSADGTGTSYDQNNTTYNATDMATSAGADLSAGDVVITLYANWQVNTYKATFTSKGEVATIEAFDGNITKDNGEYTLTSRSTSYGGFCIPANTFEVGKRYKLTYKYQKLSGTLQTMGGSAGGQTQISFKIDGEEATNDYASSEPVSDDTNEHTVEFEFEHIANNNLYIQPNRASYTNVTLKISDIYLEEIEVRNVEYNSALGTLPNAERTGYRFIGWYTDETAGDEITAETLMPAHDTVYYAHLDKIEKYTATFAQNKEISIQAFDSHVSENNGEYTMTGRTTNYGGFCIPANTFEVGKRYKLIFTYQKVSGTLQNIGGSADGKTQISFTIDGEPVANTYASNVSVSDDTNEHVLEFEFEHTANNNLYIQPNRASSTTALIKISNIKLLAFEDTREVERDTPLGTLPETEKTGYSFMGWYTEEIGGEQISAQTLMPAHDTVYYAHYGKMGVSENPITIDLSDSSLTTVNDTQKQKSITITGENYGTVSVTSSDSTVATATVDGTTLTITAIANGTANITLTGSQADVNGNTFSITIPVTVQTTPASISVTPKTATLRLLPTNNTTQLQYTIEPATANVQNTVTWSSSDTSIATVDQTGLVTAVGGGTVTITATTANGKTDSATITVREQVEIPTPVQNLVYNGETQTGVVAESALYTLSGNTAKNAGTHTATATLTDTAVYEWTDGTTADKSIEYEIEQATVTPKAISDGTVTENGLVINLNALNNTGNNTHDSSRTTWKNLAGEGENFTIYNATWGDDYLEFDANNQSYVGLGYRSYTETTFRVKFSTSDYSGCIIGNWEDGGYGFYVTPEGKLKVEYYVGSSYKYMTSNITLEKGKIYDALVTHSKDTGAKLYINGQLEDESSVTGTIKASNNTVLMLGADPRYGSPAAELWTGKIYEVSVYNKALTEEELKYNTMPTEYTKNYDGTTAVENGIVSLSGVIGNDDVTASGDFAYESASVGNNKTINVTNIQLSGTDSLNYKLSTDSLEVLGNILALDRTCDLPTEVSLLEEESKEISFTYTGEDVTTTVGVDDTSIATATMADGTQAGTITINGVEPGTTYATVTIPASETHNSLVHTIQINVKEIVASTTIGGVTTYYDTVQAAIDAVPTDGTKATVKFLFNESREESITVASGMNVTLDLNGKELYSTEKQPVLTYGDLTVIDSVGTGKLTSYIWSAIYVFSGTVTLGENDGTVSDKSPELNGTDYSIWFENGTFNFYDGVLVGEIGKSCPKIPNSIPDGYMIIKDTELQNGILKEKAMLRKIRPDVTINTEKMYVTDGVDVRVDGSHNYKDENGEGHNYQSGVWYDSVSGTNKTVINGSWTDNALKINRDGYVVLGRYNNSTPSIHVMFSLDNNNRPIIIGNWDGSGYGIYIEDENRICSEFKISGTYRYLYSTTTVEVGKIYDVCVTYDGEEYAMYVNGVKEATASYPGGEIINPSRDFTLGKWANSAGIIGKIYTAAIYHKGLSADEVVQNYTAGMALVGGPVSASTITYSMMFNNTVTGFDTDDIALSVGTKQTLVEETAGKYYSLKTTLSSADLRRAASQTITLRENAAVDTNSVGTPETSKTIVFDQSFANYAEYESSSSTTPISYYITLEEALSEAQSGHIIKPMKSVVDESTSSPTVSQGNSLTLDLDGKTIELADTLINNGTLDIYNSSSTEGKINSSANVSIKNSGLLTMNGTASANKVTVTNTTTAPANRILVNDSGKAATLNNNVTLIYNTAIVQPATAEDRYVVDNNGTLNINGATMTNTISDTKYEKGIANNDADSRIAMTAGNITTTGDCITNNSGTGTTTPTIEISGTTAGTTITSNRWSGICQFATGTIKIDGGSITAKQRGIYSETNSAITVTGGTIIGTNNDGIRGYTGSVTVSGSSTNITGRTYGISVTTGNITVKEGTITAIGDETTDGKGIYAGIGSQGVILGNNADAVSTTAPAVTGKTYGVQIEGNGSLHFYDGIVKGAENQAISVDGNVITPEGYGVQKTNADGKQTAILAIANYAEYNGATLINNYITLEEAFEKATSGNSIKVVNGTASSPIVDASTASPTVASGKNLKLDMNGKTIELSNTLTNNETLFIYNSSSTEGKINSSANVSIKNSGTLTMIGTASANNVTVTNTTTAPANRILVNDSGKTATLYNNVTLIYNTAIVQPATAEDRYVVDNNGILNISGATITNTISDTQYDKGIVNNNAGSRIAMTAGNITTTGDCITNNSGTGTTTPTVKISGTTAGTTITSNRWSGISQYATGTIKVNGGSITGKQRGIYSEATSEIIVTGGTITGTNNDGIRGYTGNVTVSGSSTNITGKTYGISVRTGKITVTEGTVTATDGIGVYAGVGNQGVTLGNNANAVDTTAPAVTGTTYGVQVLGTENLNFYDGIVKGAENQAISVGGEVVTPQGYGVQKTNADGKQTAILVIANYAEYDGDTLVSNYTTLAEAFEKAKSGNTIKVLNGTASSAFADASTSSPTVASGKTLTLDLNEKVMTIGQKITNNGTLTVTSLTDGGKLSSSANFGIDNLGTGTVSLLGGTIEKTGTGTAVYNESTGEIVVNGGTINHKASNGAALNNKVGGTITVIKGTVESNEKGAIYNQLDGTITVTGGTITGSEGIYCVTPEDTTKKATVTITGGIIEGKSKQGVRIGIGTGTIGTKETTPSVSTTVPSITGYTNGISVSETGTLNIYDGVFVGKSGEGSAITGNVSEVQSGYAIQKTLSTEDELSVETAILAEANYAEYNGASLVNNYVTLADALKNATSGNTIKPLKTTLTETVKPTQTDTTKTLTLKIPSGYTIALSGQFIDNDGTLKVKGTGTGTLTSTACAIRNDGTLYVEDSVSIKGIGTGDNSTINNFGTMIVNNATITSNVYMAIFNQSTGTLEVKGNNTNITSTGHTAIANQGTAKIYEGTITSNAANKYGLLNTNGTASIFGGKINAVYRCIRNSDNGSLTISGGEFTATGVSGNSYSTQTLSIAGGTVNVSGGTFTSNKGDSSNAVIGELEANNTSNVTITGGTFTGPGGFTVNGAGTLEIGGTASITATTGKGISKAGTAAVNITGGSITASADETIYNNNVTGTVTISGGTIINSAGAGFAAVKNDAAGTIKISGGTISKTNSNVSQGNAPAVTMNAGNLEMTGGEILSVQRCIHLSSTNTETSVEIKGGKLIATGKTGITWSIDAINAGAGQVKISGGTLTATKGDTNIEANAIKAQYSGARVIITGGDFFGETNGICVVNSSASVTLGTNDGTVNSVDDAIATEPRITGGTYGVKVSSGAFNFYDGVIKGATNQSIVDGSENATMPTATPTGYGVYKSTANSIETAILATQVNFDFNTENDMNRWKFAKQDRFTAVNYDSSTGMNTITVNGNSGWEYIWTSITTTVGKEYTISFDYENPQDYETTSSNTYEGLGAQVMEPTAYAGNNNLSGAITTTYLPRTATAKARYEIKFTATNTSTYLLFNFGMIKDGVSTTVKLGNFVITEAIPAGTALGDLPDLTLTGYTFNGWYTAKTGGTKITSATTSTSANAGIMYYAQSTINKYYLTYDYQDSYTYSGSNALDTGYKYDWGKNFKVESKFKVTTLGKRYAVFSAWNDTTKNLALEITESNKLRIYMGTGSIDDKSSTTIPANVDITAVYEWNASTKTYTLTATGTNVDISMTGTLSSMTGTGTKNVLVGRDERTNVFNPINITMFKISTEYEYNTTISTLPTVTKPEYIYNGWYDAASGGNKVTSVTIPAANKTIYAQKTAANYGEYNGSTWVKGYLTLAEAMSGVTSGNTIKPLSDRPSEAAATLASGKTVTLDLNGKTITMTGSLTNAGTLTINGSGKVNNTAIMDLIKNSGTLTLAGSVEVSNDSTSTSNKTVYNTGTVIVDGATVNSEEYIAIYNDGTSGKVEVKSGTVIAKNKAIQNSKGTANTTSSPAVKISGGIVESTGYNAIWNDASGMVYITGGTVTSNSRTIWNNGTGKIKIEDGNIISTGTIVGTVDGVKHYNPDTVVNQGSGSLEVSGGTITCERSSSGIAMGGTGSLTVTGGTITGISNGIWVTSSNTPTITIGNNSDGVSITSPKITGTTNGIATGTGKIYFYDGIITGATDKAITESGTVTNATNCVTVKTNANGKQTAVNGPSAPTITAKLSNSSGATYTSGDWTNKNVWVSLTSSKVGSGISEYQWYENGAWTKRNLSTTGNTGEITYSADRNLTIRFRAVDTNGIASEEATYTIRRDTVKPTITVSPTSATACTSKSVTITAADTGGSGLSSSNSYQYYLSTSSTALQGGSWTNYTSGTAFTLGSGKNGTFYLFVKRVRDNAGNVSTANGTEQTVGGTTYQRFGTYVFAQNYTVTADANGGTIPATTGWTVASGSKTATKSVSYNSTYGTLPTPTRTGYTFLGWSGKNLFNKDATPVSTSKYIKGDGTFGTSSEYSVYQVCVKPNTTYTITNSGKSNAPGYAIYNASGERVDGANYANTSVVTFTTPATAVYMKFSVVTQSTSNRYDKETFQLEENSAATAYEAYYVVDSSTKVTKTANHKITAQWSINEYNLTINPNGGTYDGNTSNTTVTKHYGTYYGLNTPTNSNYILTGWTNSGSGTLLRGDASGKADTYSTNSFTETVKTDADGSQYTNYACNRENTGTGTIYPYIRYSKYSFTPGHTYRISLDLRINSYSGLGYFDLRHACIPNDYSSTGRVAKGVASSAAGQGWINYTMDRTWSDTTIASANKASNVAINPLFEIYTSIPAGNTGVVDFDIRNIVIEDITDNTTVSNGTYDGYVYRFGDGDGSVTAQWDKAMFNNGKVVNSTMKYLAGNSDTAYFAGDVMVKNFEHYTGDTPVSTEENVSVSSIPIYMWFDDRTIYWWSEDDTPYLNRDCSYLFNELCSLTSVDLNGLDTSNVTSMYAMFYDCYSLTSLDLSGLDTSNVTSMYAMFYDCSRLTSLDLSGLDTGNVTDMQLMFYGCSRLTSLDLSGLDTSNVTRMNAMFYDCRSLTTIYASNLFNTDNVTSSPGMFKNCTSLIGGSGTAFNSSYTDKAYAHIDGGTSNPGYFTAKSTTNSAPQSLSLNSVNSLRKLSITRNTLTNSISTEDTQTSTDVENTSENINNTETIDTNESNDNVLVELPKTVQLNGTNYPSISEAIAVANKGETIKLLEDISLTDEVIIEEGKEVIINLNGKTLTSTSNNTINNAGTLTITGTGIVRNEVENGNVIYNTGILNIENGVITTDKNGGKAVYNSSDYSKYDQVKEVTVVGGEEKEELRNAITFNMKGGKIVTEGIGSIGVYNAKNNRGVITGGIVEVRKSASTGIYNDSELEISDAKVVVADYDATGIYNSDSASICELKGTELTIEAEEIENYELIKNTDQFKAELEEMKPSYGVYNDSKSLNVVIETAVIKAERLKSVAIMNASEGEITLGVDELEGLDDSELSEDSEISEDVSDSSPIIYAIADNTTAIVNSENGKINFYDGKILTISTIKNVVNNVLKNYEIYEELSSKFISSTLRLIETEVEKQVQVQAQPQSQSQSDVQSNVQNEVNTEVNTKVNNEVQEEVKANESNEVSDSSNVEEKNIVEESSENN